MKKKDSVLDAFHAPDGIHIRTELSELQSERNILRALRKLQRRYPNTPIHAATGTMPGPDDGDILLASCLQCMGGTSESILCDNRFIWWTLAPPPKN